MTDCMSSNAHIEDERARAAEQKRARLPGVPDDAQYVPLSDPDGTNNGRPSFTPGMLTGQAVGPFLPPKAKMALGAAKIATAHQMPGPALGGGSDGQPVSETNPRFVKADSTTKKAMAIFLAPIPVFWIIAIAYAAPGYPGQPTSDYIGFWLICGFFALFLTAGCAFLAGLVYYTSCRTNRKEVQMVMGAVSIASGMLDEHNKHVQERKDQERQARDAATAAAAAAAANQRADYIPPNAALFAGRPGYPSADQVRQRVNPYSFTTQRNAFSTKKPNLYSQDAPPVRQWF